MPRNWIWDQSDKLQHRHKNKRPNIRTIKLALDHANAEIEKEAVAMEMAELAGEDDLNQDEGASNMKKITNLHCCNKRVYYIVSRIIHWLRTFVLFFSDHLLRCPSPLRRPTFTVKPHESPKV